MSKVLLVDDDELLLRSLQRTLSARGFEVRLARGPDQALELVTEVDVVVSDIRMPGYSGIEFLREIRGRHCDTPVILMTGSPELDTAMAAVEHGAVHYLLKPFGIDMLKGLIERAVVNHVPRHGDFKLLGDLLTLGARFDEALAKMYMVFQPIVSVARRRPIAYESLLRTDEPTLKNPMAFVSAAEHLKRLPVLGRRIRALVAEQLKEVPPDVDAFVNLHPLDVGDEALFDPGAPLSAFASRVVLELTERAGLDDVDDTPGRIARLRQMGFRLAVDDLGAGYAGLSSVATLAPDVIKLDVTLIRGIHDDERRQRMVASLASLFKELKTPTVVEGVETAAERDAILALGADIMQGYLFARPQRGFATVPESAFGG
jgi:EAL domain-containing protein (putative c-di-GMP-specific phosphodiesterase class I)